MKFVVRTTSTRKSTPATTSCTRAIWNISAGQKQQMRLRLRASKSQPASARLAVLKSFAIWWVMGFFFDAKEVLAGVNSIQLKCMRVQRSRGEKWNRLDIIIIIITGIPPYNSVIVLLRWDGRNSLFESHAAKQKTPPTNVDEMGKICRINIGKKYSEIERKIPDQSYLRTVKN